ncbi:MAG: SDR family oxidoreductase [Pyrinomonadaceae bacterium]|nr:SDR family oxidoreductase [Pyrinomonadaceae bacterium]
MMKTMVIVGASKGIGSALAQRLSNAGHSVIALSRTEGDTCDIPNVRSLEYDAIGEGDFPFIEGSVDGIVYCPGSINLKPFIRLTEKEFLTDLNINLLGSVKTIQSLLPNLKEAEDPSIVLFSTVAVQTGMGFHSSISAAKGAVEGLTRALAAEFAPKIRVNCIAPSLTDTSLAERLLNSEEKRVAVAGRNPLNKIGTPDDVAAMAEFLLTGGSRWITGQILHVDGGMGMLR